METPKTEVAAVREALKAGQASQSTFVALQSLLSPETAKGLQASKTDQTKRTKLAITNSKPTSAASSKTAREKRAAPVLIHEDVQQILSARERYALATETANICLKALADRSKRLNKAQSESSSSDTKSPSTPQRSKGEPSILDHTLQPRSVNATPVRSSPTKLKATGAEATNGALPTLEVTAECAHLAFAFLRNAKTENLNVREMPKLQLETGMLALVGSLIVLGLESLAVKELRLVKRSLEALTDAQKNQSKDSRTSTKAAPEKETLATLLHLKGDFESCAEALPLAINYQSHVLRIICNSRRPTAMEHALPYLSLRQRNSPADLIVRQAQRSQDVTKAAKQLESVAQSILSACPSVSASEDKRAKDPEQSPAPAAVLALQVIALRMRKGWWDLVKHQPETSKELLEPFSRCASALIRRLPTTYDVVEVYELLNHSLDRLGPFDSETFGTTLFNIHYILSMQAELAGKASIALEWTAKMIEDCSTLEKNHARRLASLAKEVAMKIQQGILEVDNPSLYQLASCFETSSTGNWPDFDILITALGGLARAICSAQERSRQSKLVTRPLCVFASFALRYARSYPGKATNNVHQILDAALRYSTSAEDLTSWVTEDAVQVLVQVGAVRSVMNVASNKPLSEAWKASSAAISLSRILRALMLKALRTGTDGCIPSAFDIDNMEPAERGAVLEHQLKFAIELAPKTKYHDGLRNLVPKLSQLLSKCYTAAAFPVRRARVAAGTFRLRECQSDLVPPHIFKVWREYAPPDHGEYMSDSGLAGFYQDLKAGIKVSKAFSDGSPTMEDLKPSLTTWEEILDNCDNTESLCSKIDDPTTLEQQLQSIAAYSDMLGNADAGLHCQCLLVKLTKLSLKACSEYCIELFGLAKRYVDLGNTERANELLYQASQIAQRQDASPSAKTHWHLTRAEYLLSIEDLDECRTAIENAGEWQLLSRGNTDVKDDRKAHELLHAQGLLVQSMYMLKTGSPHEALSAARRSVKSLNSIWTGLSRSSGNSTPERPLGLDEAAQTSTNGLTQGIKKLQLTPTEPSTNDSVSKPCKKGAAFWPLVPLICKGMVHLSEIYAHHGRFSEGNYYSEHAIHIAESVQSSYLLSRLRISRSRLLTLAGRLEEAELCLNLDDVEQDKPSLDVVGRYCAMAAIRAKENSWEEAMSAYCKAEQVLDGMSSTLISNVKVDGPVSGPERRQGALNPKDVEATARRATKSKSKAINTRVSRPKSARSIPSSKAASKAPGVNDSVGTACDMLAKARARLLLGKTFAGQRLGRSVEEDLAILNKFPSSMLESYRICDLWYANSMQKAIAAVQMDVTFNVILESTLSVPATRKSERKTQSGEIPRATAVATKGAKGPKKSDMKLAKSKAVPTNSFQALFMAAKDHLMSSHLRGIRFDSTAQTHVACAMLSNVDLLSAATSGSQASHPPDPVSAGLAIDLPRIKAAEFERKALLVDGADFDITETQTSQAIKDDSFNELSAAQFQELYIDVIPKSWTAVSLCLSEDANELYIARYRSGQTPFVLRLPFSRHKPDDLDEEAFDYHIGKAELQDIIELSNYSCHNNGISEGKGKAKTWWNEREALDRRLHELLINMENIWFGGFKSVFSTVEKRQDLIVQFRKSFEDILDRYLPSRQATKPQAERLVVDDQVLELFIALAQGGDAVDDIDEPLTDLLYFVVDMLQFNGERDAYDEIDFDSVVVDVNDAIRSYYDLHEDATSDARHLILILDRRLQAFPWESLPFLQESSVSRVNSMLSLRERILAMRGRNQHVVPRASGTYILNPSSDLRTTQTTLQPALSTLRDEEGAKWTPIVNEEPDEDRFKSALSNDSMMLYFGHGGGSQYIRPRSVKRLNTCSEVVWLMGCSSGAVTEYGELEPFAVPLAYLQAGTKDAEVPGDQAERNSKCMAVIATLWDVTDKDIDRFSLALGEEWGLWPASEPPKLPLKTPRKREVVAPPSTPQRAPKTPKTPKALKTPVVAKTPVRSRSRSKKDAGASSSLVEAVARSRDACYLRYLNGAAPVLYGVPVYLGE